MAINAHAHSVRDMTTGKPLELILRFAFPLFIGNIFQQFYNMVDTMVVGYHLGDTAIAAVGATTSLYSLVFFFINGLNNGYGIIVTQRFGARNIREMKQAIAGMILLDMVITLVISSATVALLPLLMRFLNTPQSIFDDAYSYISIIFGGLVFTIAYNMFAAILRAMGNSRVPLYFLILSSLLNIGLDLLFVITFSMGIQGAAIATVLAQLISAASCGAYTLRNFREYLPGKQDFRVPGNLLADLFSQGLSMALMSCLVDIGSVVFQRATNLLGQTVITAYTASRKILNLMLQPQATLASANATFTAQNWGAKQPRRIRDTLKQVLILEIGWSLTAMAVIWFFGEEIIFLTTGTRDPEVLRNAVLSLRLHFSMFPFLGILFCLRNAMQSMGMRVIPLFSSCLELGVKLCSAAVLIPSFGFVGTCITEPSAWLIMSVFLICVYLKDRKRLFGDLSV